jgi:energy-coupling factor transport system ATP-binding protein
MDLAMDMLTISSFSYIYPGAATPALLEVSCTVRAGECVCLTGSSGCGKSTLLLAIKGVLRGGSRSGTIDIVLPPGEGGGSSPVGIVFQNAETQILCSTVAEEVAFAPENLCVPPDEIARRVTRALRDVGLEGYQSRSVERFSAGQKQRLAIASVLSMNPSLLLVDEPTSQLDRRGKLELCDLLGKLKRQGYTIIMAEHETLPFAGIIDRYLTLEGGRVVSSSGALSDSERHEARPCFPPGFPPTTRAPALSVRELTLSYPETGVVLNGVDLTLARGERGHLWGPNGAGKSSLLRCLCGLERPDSGTIDISGVCAPRLEKLAGQVGVLFQNPARQLFAESVREEVAFTLERLGYPRDECESRVEQALEFCNIGQLAPRPPLTLSFGEQHRVALAAVLAPRPRLLLLDEPFAGLDFPQRRSLLALLAELPERYGTAVLIATHDMLPDPCWADRSFWIENGRISDVAC